MADEPKPEQTPASPSISPAPSEVADNKADAPKSAAQTEAEANQAAVNAAKAQATAQSEALPDGTMPTVLAGGSTHKSVPKGKASITSIYRRADITTTIITFVGASVAAGLIIGGYAFFSRNNTPAVEKPPVTQLDKDSLDKIDAFFDGNSAGKTAEVLTVSSSSLFKERVAMASDLKVVGGVQVSGTTALADLTVDKVATLGVTTVRGALTVAGPLNLQSPAILGAGATVNGNLTTSGNGSFGGTLSAGTLSIRDLSVAGTLNLAGHLSITGSNPTVAPNGEAGPGATTNVVGNDAGGTVTINTGAIPTSPFNNGGLLATVTFRVPYARTPNIVISPIGQNGAKLQYYVIKTANNFIIGSAIDAAPNTQYVFDYWIVQ